MKKTLLAVTLAALMGGAYASGSNHHNTYNGGGTGIGVGYGGAGGNASASSSAGALAGAAAFNQTNVDASNYSSNRNTNSPRSYAYGGRSDQEQSQGQDNHQSLEYNEANSMRYSGGYDVKTNPSMGLGGISPTVPCAIPVEGTYSGVGIGIGLGTAYVEDGCVRDRLIKSGLTSGNPEAVAKAAQLLNHDLDAELAKIAPRKSEQPVASGADSSERDVWAFQNL